MLRHPRYRRVRDSGWLLVIVLLTMWPFVHNYLQRAHDFSPWKLFGFAMYTQPSEQWYIRVIDPRTNQTTLTLTEAESHYQWLWGFRTSTFGLYTNPDPFAEHLLEVRPELSAIRIQFDEFRWRAHLSRYGVQTLIYDYYYDEEGALQRRLSRDEVLIDRIHVPRTEPAER